MANRFELEFPGAGWTYTVPPIGPDGHQVYLERARQARAEALSATLRALGRGIAGIVAPAVRFVRCASFGAAKRTPARLTAPCR